MIKDEKIGFTCETHPKKPTARWVTEKYLRKRNIDKEDVRERVICIKCLSEFPEKVWGDFGAYYKSQAKLRDFAEEDIDYWPVCWNEDDFSSLLYHFFTSRLQMIGQSHLYAVHTKVTQKYFSDDGSDDPFTRNWQNAWSKIKGKQHIDICLWDDVYGKFAFCAELKFYHSPPSVINCEEDLQKKIDMLKILHEKKITQRIYLIVVDALRDSKSVSSRLEKCINEIKRGREISILYMKG